MELISGLKSFTMKKGISPAFIFVVLMWLAPEGVLGQCDGGTWPLLLNATSSPQYFTSPNYPSNYPANANCSWRVYAPNVYDKIIINIEDYDSESVTSDYMDLYDGFNSSSERIVRMAVTNRKTVNGFVSSTDVLYFTFVSDYTIQYSGFQILYFSNDTANQPDCDTELTVATEDQILMSPNLPDIYNGFDSCAWSFQGSTGILFQIKFMDMATCGGTNHLRFYDGNSTADQQLETECTTSLTYEFDPIETTGFTGHVAWTVTNQSSDYFGFMLVYRLNIVTTTTTTVATTTLAPGAFDNCTASGAYLNATIAPNFDYVLSPGFEDGSYPSHKFCRWYISAPNDYAVEAYFDNQTYAIERNPYCSYDYVIFYDGNLTTDTMLNKFCGFTRPQYTYRSSGSQMLIVFSSDYILEYAGFRIRIQAVSNVYPACKADYTDYDVMYNKETSYIFNNYTFINNISSLNFGASDYPLNVELFWLFTSYNTTHFKMILDIISIDIERAYNCLYDKLILYDGPCMKDGVRDTVCGRWAKRWDLEGPEYLLQFHSDGYKTSDGFQIIYYAVEKDVAPPATTTTTTLGPPVEAVIEAVKALLTNYSTENLPLRNLSEAITASIDFYLVGINGLDEVEQKMTSTGQFEVKWKDSSLGWDPTKRQGVVQVLLPQNDVWKPDIALMNGFTSITAMGAKFMFINVDYNGTCLWKPYQIMESVCKVDMTHYPYDRQTCVLKFGTWSTDDSEVVTELGSRGLQIHPNFQENAEWRLITTETRQEDNNNHKVVEFFLTLERNPRYVTYYMTIPIIVLAYMNVFTFVIPSESGEKTGYCITIFLSFVVLLIINNESLPENSDTLSLYAAFVLTMTIMSAVALIVSVLQIRALTFTERRYPIANCVKSLVKYVKKLQSVVTCDRKRSDKVDKEDDKQDGSERQDSGLGESVKESPVLVKKVSFKDDNESEKEDEYNRFTLPVNHGPLKTSFKTDRENTLFEPNTFVRSATALSLAEDLKEKKNGGRDVATKTVKFADASIQHVEKGKTPDMGKSNTGIEDDSKEMGGKTETITSSLTKAKSNSSAEQTNLSSQSTEPNSSASLIEHKTYEHFETQDETPSTSSMELYSTSSKQEDNVHSILTVSPSAGSESHEGGAHEQNTMTSAVDKENDKNIPSKDQNLMVTGISQSGTNRLDTRNLSTDLLDSNSKVLKAVEDAVSSQNESNGQQSAELGSSPQQSNSITNGLEPSINISGGNQPGTLADDVMTSQPTSATDVRMNRPSSSADSRPISVNRLFSSSGNRVVLVDHGRAISAGKSRPISRNGERAISSSSRTSVTFNTDRPISRSKPEDTSVLLFGAEEMDKRSPDVDEEMTSTKSDDSINESSESSESSCAVSDVSDESDLSWTDLVSCTDALFFVIYLFITTLMTLAMFLTMIHAY